MGAHESGANFVLQTYVAMKINEGQANAIACMAYKCNTKLDETFIPKFVCFPSNGIFERVELRFFAYQTCAGPGRAAKVQQDTCRILCK